MSDRVVVIGLDGADWRIVRPLMASGVMPNLRALVEAGASGSLESSIPTHSNTAWVTFLTGVNPGKHGVFSFMERAPNDPLQLVGVTSRSNKRETILHVLSRQGFNVGAVNVPVTYPPFPVSGFLLSGMFVPEGAAFTYPLSLAGELQDRVGGFPLNRIRWRFMAHKYRELLIEANSVNEQRARVLDYLMDRKPWDVYVQVFVSPDRIQHALMHLIDPEHPRYQEQVASEYRELIWSFYHGLDAILGRVAERARRSDFALIVLSDHGFQSCDRELYVPQVLVEHGLMSVSYQRMLGRRVRRLARRALGGRRSSSRSAQGPRIGPEVDWRHTRAYVTTATDQGVSVNMHGREPYGIVNTNGGYARTREDIRAALLGLADPKSGGALVDGVWFREELYHGPALEEAPDVVFAPARGLTTVGERSRNLAPLQIRTGEHALQGIFVGYGGAFKPGSEIHGARLIDLAPTILYLAGAAIPRDFDGKVLLDALNPTTLRGRAISYEQSQDVIAEERDYSVAEEAQIAEQLRGLGYL